MKQQIIEVAPLPEKIPPTSLIGKRSLRGNLMESVIRRKGFESEDDDEGFDLMKQARQAIN